MLDNLSINDHHSILIFTIQEDKDNYKNVSVRADLRRIKWIRNLMQNNGSKKMSNKDFQQYWDDISGVRLFLNTRTCTPYTKPFIQILNSMKNENNIFIVLVHYWIVNS
jgi:hypothetical protein